MSQRTPEFKSQITFLYYRDLSAASEFYRDVMGLELVEDQVWAQIFRVGGNAFVGIVNEEKGYFRAQDDNAVLLTLVADDVSGWYDHLQRHGVKMLTPLQEKKDIQVRCFFVEDPGGYALEIQEFLKPDLAQIFHGQAR